jgi:hypothetical protein
MCVLRLPTLLQNIFNTGLAASDPSKHEDSVRFLNHTLAIHDSLPKQSCLLIGGGGANLFH